MRVSSALPLAVCLTLLALYARLPAPANAQEPGLQPGQGFVDFGLDALDFSTGALGKGLWLHNLVGRGAKQPKKLVLLNFFSVDCEPCERELPELVRLQDAYGEHGLQVLMINTDPPKRLGRTLPRTVALMKKLGLPNFPVLFEYIDRTKLAYIGSSAALPCNVLIGGDGIVLERYQGAATQQLAALEKSIRSRLGVQP